MRQDVYWHNPWWKETSIWCSGTLVETQWLMQTSHLIWIWRQSFPLLSRTQHRNHFKSLDFECKATNGAHQVLWFEEALNINSLCHGRRNQYLVSYCMRLCSSHKSFHRVSPFTAHDIMWSAGNHIQVCLNFRCKKYILTICPRSASATSQLWGLTRRAIVTFRQVRYWWNLICLSCSTLAV